jgi:hypothetical protein
MCGLGLGICEDWGRDWRVVMGIGTRAEKSRRGRKNMYLPQNIFLAPDQCDDASWVFVYEGHAVVGEGFVFDCCDCFICGAVLDKLAFDVRYRENFSNLGT